MTTLAIFLGGGLLVTLAVASSLYDDLLRARADLSRAETTITQLREAIRDRG